jgi:hypothetical protein
MTSNRLTPRCRFTGDERQVRHRQLNRGRVKFVREKGGIWRLDPPLNARCSLQCIVGQRIGEDVFVSLVEGVSRVCPCQ